MRKISGYEKIVISFGVIVGVFFLVSVMKCVSYSIVLADGSTWNALSIYKMLGVDTEERKKLVNSGLVKEV